MDDITLFIGCFVNLFAIVNPLGAFPVFVATTSGLSPSVRFRVGTVCAGTVAFVLVIALLIGQFILNFFGISISSFRTAGGIFICLLSLSMLRGSMTEARKEGQATAALEEEGAIGQAIVPLAIPILAGPGAISSIIVYSSQITHFRQWFVIGGAILLFGSILWLMFCSAGWLQKILGPLGINISTRVMGLIMMSLGVEIMSTGLKGIFPILGG